MNPLKGIELFPYATPSAENLQEIYNTKKYEKNSSYGLRASNALEFGLPLQKCKDKEKKIQKILDIPGIFPLTSQIIGGVEIIYSLYKKHKLSKVKNQTEKSLDVLIQELNMKLKERLDLEEQCDQEKLVKGREKVGKPNSKISEPKTELEQQFELIKKQINDLNVQINCKITEEIANQHLKDGILRACFLGFVPFAKHKLDQKKLERLDVKGLFSNDEIHPSLDLTLKRDNIIELRDPQN